MTTNKPEVVACLHTDKENPEHRGVSLHHDMSCTSTFINTEPLIRLSDYEALQAELDSLRARTSLTMGVGRGDGRLFVHGDYESIKAAQKMVLELEAVRAECDQLRKDAERYRFLRDAESLPMNLMRLEMIGDVMDSAIDAAMQELKPCSLSS